VEANHSQYFVLKYYLYSYLVDWWGENLLQIFYDNAVYDAMKQKPLESYLQEEHEKSKRATL
jgi:hypothetical protein